MNKPAIQARVDYLRRGAAKSVNITVADIVRQLDEDRQFARKRGAVAAAVTATTGKARCSG